MKAEQLALVRGMADTRAALRRWRERPSSVLIPWARGSLAVAVMLLVATWLVARLTALDPTEVAFARFPGVTHPATSEDYVYVLFRNALVLALHSLACVAGFMAGSSLPVVAEGHSGLWRSIHRAAGPLAIGFVVLATLFSLCTQAYVIGGDAAHLAAHLGLTPAELLLALSLHAIPELFALFLPLAAWMMASRQGRWQDLLAATLVTTAIAIPILLVSAAVETWVTPELLLAITG